MMSPAASPPTGLIITASEAEELCRSHFARTETPVSNLTLIGWHLNAIGDDAPAGFLSQQLRLTVKCCINKRTTCELQFFVKTTAAGSAAQAAYVADFGAFQKEIRLYRGLLPRLMETGETDFAPHCYLSRTDGTMIVFEDLSVAGFSNAPGTGDGLLDRAHLLLTVEALARMHAASMIFEKQQNQTLANCFARHLDENAYPVGASAPPARLAWVATTTATIVALLAEIPALRERRADAAQLSADVALAIGRIFELCQPSVRFRNCFGHGDLWKNNVMFKYARLSAVSRTVSEEEPRDAQSASSNTTSSTVLPVDVKFVDFQLARYAPPALDLMTICTMVTTAAFRQDHLAAMLDAYYTHLGAVLRQHGLSVAVELPRREFSLSCEHFRLAGLIECCLFSHMTLLPRSMAEAVVGADFGTFQGEARIATCVRAFRTDRVYRERMTEMITCLVEFVVAKR